MPTKVRLVKAMVFPVVMYGCESWTVKKAEHWRVDAFELWCWRRLLRVPWTARRSNQSILKEISPGHSLEGLMLKLNSNTLATSCEELTHWKRPWCWEGLGAGRVGDDRGWDGWMASPTWWTWVWVNSGSWWWRGRPGVLRFIGSQRVRHDWVTELNWTEVEESVFQLANWPVSKSPDPKIDSLQWTVLDSWSPEKIYLWDQGPGLITQELLCSRVLLKYEMGQRTLLTQTSEGGWRVPSSLV